VRNLRLLWILGLAALAGATLQCGSDTGPGQGLSILPGDTSLQVSSSQQFAADYGGSSVAVRWYVDGIRGGSIEKGIVTAAGLYVAPAEVPSGATVTLRAESVADTVAAGSVKITITKPSLTPCVIVSPETSSVGASDQIQFSSQVTNCAKDSVTWAIDKVYGNPVSPGDISSGGLYIAPSEPAFKFAVLVKAASINCPGKIGIATIVVYAQRDTFSVEMEAYTDKHDIGSSNIHAQGCGAASGGSAVLGMDNAGEWIKVPFTVPATGTYQPYLYYQSMGTGTIMASMELSDCGGSQARVSFTLDQGDGIG